MNEGPLPLRRPLYHFTARQGWINDPLGVTFRHGRVDLFYQHVADANRWWPHCRWGHATSTDLVSWEERPPALVPGDGDGGCWSGCVVVAEDQTLILYTAVSSPDLAIGRVRAAWPDDDSWDSWAKGQVVAELPNDIDAFAFRDPFVWRDHEQWRMLVGAGLRGGTAAVLTFVSPDLVSWTYDGIFAQRSTLEREPLWTGALWECPQLVRVGGEEFLVVSVWENEVLHYVACARGIHRAGRFDIAGWQRLTHGPSHYAASSFRDDEGRLGLVYWLREIGGRSGTWIGALSVPHRLSVQDGALVAEPHPRIHGAHSELVTHGRRLDGPTRLALPSWHCDIQLSLGQGKGHIRLRVLPAGGSAQAAFTLELDSYEGTLTITTPDDRGGPWTTPVPSPPTELRVLLDGCMAEVFAGPAGVLAVPLAVEFDEAAPDLEVHAAEEWGAVLTVWDMGMAQLTDDDTLT